MNRAAIDNLTPAACRRLLGWFHEASGIRLSESKRTLVASRLRRRLVALELPDFDAYCRYLETHEDSVERQLMVDLLTTNETYFFREPAHFQYLTQQLCGEFGQRSLRLWSAASSSGEEAYSLAMTLREHGRGPWEIVASDLSTRMLERTQRGLYAAQRLESLPQGYLQRYFLRGTGRYEGYILVQRELRDKVRVLQHNLLQDAARLGKFDVIFLRNVLIYFDAQAKEQIVARACAQLTPGGLLFLGHADAMVSTNLPLQRVAKSVFRREA